MEIEQARRRLEIQRARRDFGADPLLLRGRQLLGVAPRSLRGDLRLEERGAESSDSLVGCRLVDAEDVPAGDPGLKVLRVDGKNPNEDGYPLAR